ncbi:hypothetical protein COR24_18425 [Vibrio cholerae]|uniref:hypothetical protein n=1 Tax=Vibrio cholerae TaxID=666 RepID=UPI001F918801|nr:hypothetical protein [Vibrio cholerae]EGR5448479.1 hypothetical protein [Vibrio cholerae]EGR5456490.1 hypothetical protein [Vibrio cholerae]MEB5622287.1 hypothetical protein [Vibrio cholerae]
MKKIECKQVRILSTEELELVNGGGFMDKIRDAFKGGGCGGTAKKFHDAFTKGGSNTGRDDRNWGGGCNSRADSGRERRDDRRDKDR